MNVPSALASQASPHPQPRCSNLHHPHFRPVLSPHNHVIAHLGFSQFTHILWGQHVTITIFTSWSAAPNIPPFKSNWSDVHCRPSRFLIFFFFFWDQLSRTHTISWVQAEYTRLTGYTPKSHVLQEPGLIKFWLDLPYKQSIICTVCPETTGLAVNQVQLGVLYIVLKGKSHSKP